MRRILAKIAENGSLKLISLGLAIAFYATLHSGGDSQRTLEVELLRGPQSDPTRVLLTQLPPRVHVTVQGPRTLLDDLTTPIGTLSLDLSAQPTIVRLDDYPLKLPTGVQKVNFNPNTLNLRWDVKVNRLVKVEPTWSSPPEGLALKPSGLKVVPNTVNVIGPRSRVEPIQKLLTVSLDLKERREGPHVQSLFLDLANENLSDGTVTFDPEFVEVHFELVPETRTKTFSNLPVIALRGHVTLRPKEVSVVVTCPPKRIEELSSGAIVPKIDLEALGPDFAKKGPEDAEVQVEVDGCSEITVSPPRVTVSR